MCGFLNFPMDSDAFECPNFQVSYLSFSSGSYMVYCIFPLIISCPGLCGLAVPPVPLPPLPPTALSTMWNRWALRLSPPGTSTQVRTNTVICKKCVPPHLVQGRTWELGCHLLKPKTTIVLVCVRDRGWVNITNFSYHFEHGCFLMVCSFCCYKYLFSRGLTKLGQIGFFSVFL